MWADTLETIAERPVFGFGEGQFRKVADASHGRFNHPHNIVLQLLVQWGIVGAILAVALLYRVIARAHLAARRSVRDLLPAWMVTVAVLTLAMYEGAMFHPYPLSVLALALAYLLSGRRPEPKPSEE